MHANRRLRRGPQLFAALCLLSLAAAAQGRPFANRGGAGMVPLPYLVQDGSGGNWRFYQGGWFQQNSNMPLYSQGAMLTIDGQAPNGNGNSALLDPKTGELVFEDMAVNGASITRHVLLDKAGGYVRYIDVVKNTQNTPKTFALMIQSSCNYGINAGQDVADPKKKDQNMGWVGQTGANQSVVEMFASKGAKVAPRINWPQGNNIVQGTISLTLAPGKSAAVMHLHAIAPTQAAGAAFITDFKEEPLLKSIPPALRKLIINFRAAQDFIGDLEILRGDLLDVVELRGGDAFKGTLKETGYDLQTFYGSMQLPVDQVLGVINVGQFKPRQLLVTRDGQILGGCLKKQTIELEMSSGQVTQIPLNDISRIGYRRRVGEPEEWTFNQPIVLLRTGERLSVKMPTEPIGFVTRYGTLSLAPTQVAAVQLQNEDNSVDEIELTDGSRFAGLLSAPSFDMTLDAGATQQPVKIPVSAITRLQLTPKVAEPDENTPTIKLSNDDELIGSLTGRLKLATAFDTLDINAPELRALTHVPDGGAQDVRVTLWDGGSFSGRLEDMELTCQLQSGVTMRVAVPLVEEYSQPQPQPSAAIIQKIKEVVEHDLVNDDYHVRDHARQELLSLGPAVASVLKTARLNQPPEAQKSIDMILADLDKQAKGAKPPAGPNP